MIEITSNRLNLIPHITELLKYNYIIYSIFEGSVPGKVFVDELPTPKVILVWDGTSDSGIYIEGQNLIENLKKANIEQFDNSN
ncbi:MAG: hypothetical protein ACTSVZ_10860 [Promethearchaeota archaeon]